jgi:hypothetical protein
MKWAIYGTLRWAIDEMDPEPIVTFDSVENAYSYIKKSKLKRKRYGREFKYDSMLCGYRDVYVDEYKPVHPPHEPT